MKSEDPNLPHVLFNFLSQKQLRDVTVTSFYENQLVRMRSLSPSLPLCYLIRQNTSEGISEKIKQAKRLGFNEIAVAAEAIEAHHVRLARTLQLPIRDYGVKKKEHFDHLLALGVYGSTLDWPEWVKTP